MSLKNKNRSHGLMFHHFHNETHPLGQGSISENDFRNIIKYYSNNFNVISADIYLDKILSNKLDECDVCLTFDDNLKCQYEIALPVLDELNLKAFWFVYTSPLNGSYEKVETRNLNEFLNPFIF